MKIEREEYEKFVAAEMKKNEKKQNGKEESK